MSQRIDAIYDNGVLRPLVPLTLPDKSQVSVTIEICRKSLSISPPQDDWERSLVNLAVDCAVSLPDSALSSEGLYE